MYLHTHTHTQTHTHTHTHTHFSDLLYLPFVMIFFWISASLLVHKMEKLCKVLDTSWRGRVSRSTIYGDHQLWEGEQLTGLSKYFSTRNLHFLSILVPVTSESLKSTRVVRVRVRAHTYTRVCVWREHEVKLTKVDLSTSQELLHLYQQWFSTRIYGGMRTHV